MDLILPAPALHSWDLPDPIRYVHKLSNEARLRSHVSPQSDEIHP